MLCLYVKDPCLKLCETRFRVAELERLLGVLDSPPVKSPGIMELASDIDTYNQSVFRYCFNFCVLRVRLHLKYLFVL